MKYKKLIANLIKPYSSILFLDNYFTAFFILVISFIIPSVAISGILAIIFTLIFSKAINLADTFFEHNYFIFNSLLVGMGVGYIFNISLASILLIFICSAFTFLLTYIINNLFRSYKLPILTLPFSIVSILLYFACIKHLGHSSYLLSNTNIAYNIELPLIISQFFKSLGSIFFLASNIVGGLLFIIILYFSRIIALMAVVGYYFGILINSLLIGSFYIALYDVYAFNYILVAIALCGVFLLPTIRNFFISLIAVGFTVIITKALENLFSYYGVPVFTLPFNIIVISFIFVLYLSSYKEFNYNILSTPEQSLLNYLNTILRFGTTYKKISLPFSGKWSIYQGFDDKWTHKGEYKFAYDFVKKIDNKTYKSDKYYLENYFSFGQPILSPVAGYIVDARHDLLDNPIGETDRINNWGNYIIIKSNLGFFVKISHLMQFSLNFKIGDYVNTNDVIAKCGNSGYSPEPHIHIQVQNNSLIGSATSTFCFKNYLSHNQLIYNATPQTNIEIESTVIDKGIKARLLFVLDDKFEYKVYKDNIYQENITFTVHMNNLSQFYFQDDMKNQLYFYSDTTEFYFYNYIGKESFLRKLFILMPRLPFINRNNTTYIDHLPIHLIKSNMYTKIVGFISILKKDFYKEKRIYKYSNNIISSEYGHVELQTINRGFKHIIYENYRLEIIC